MITKRLFIYLVILLTGLGAALMLPKHVEEPAAGVKLALPDYVGEWYGRDASVTEVERTTLGPETEFARKLYCNGRGDELYVSIVLGGHDMNTSIHRPERCLPAQGYTILPDSRITRIDLSPSPLSVMRLHTSHQIAGAPVGKDFYSLNYYWFIGSSETTASHYTRTMIDMRDRLLKGTVQRWAYVTVVSSVTDGLTKFGRSEKEVDKTITEFIKLLVPVIEKPGVERS